MSPFTPWQQPQSAPVAAPSPYGTPPLQPASPYGASAPQPMPPPVQPDPMARVMPLIQQANIFLPHVTANQLAIPFVIAAVGKRTNSHPYFPAAEDRAEMQILHQLRVVEARGEGYILTLLGDALIVAERLNRLIALA